MSNKLSSEQYSLLEKIAYKNGFANFTIDVNNGANRGDNYSSTINRVTIREGNDKRLNFIVKFIKYYNEDDAKSWINKFFEREIYAYETIFPSLKLQLSETKIFHEHPQFYGAINNILEKCVVLEDMKFKNYVLSDRHKCMNQEHVGNIFRIYGKYHANSYALKLNDPVKFDKIANHLGPPQFSELYLKAPKCFEILFKAVADDNILYNYVQKREKNMRNYFKNGAEEDEKYKVIIHGDNWCNNMLFKYKNSNHDKPSDICILDWQIVAVGSPICDLSYFFYINTSQDLLSKLGYFLKEYHTSFNETLRELGVGDVFPLEEIWNQWKKHSLYGLFSTIMVLKVALVDSDRAPDVRGITDIVKAINIILSAESDETEYNRRIKNIVEFMVDHDFL